MMLIILPGYVTIAMTVFAVVAVIGILWILFREVIHPVYRTVEERNSPPPVEGYKLETVIDTKMRKKQVSIGQLDSTVKTRLQGIKEDHLVINFERDKDLEEYNITIHPHGNVMYKHPRAKKFDIIKSEESFESRDLIGHIAKFRIIASFKGGRAIQYLDFELSSKYFFSQIGEEKIKFTLTLVRIFPQVNRNSRSKSGIFQFGRAVAEPKEEEL